ncbi:hypothetical protein KIL84_018835 [Mauremys mutica]|uniref:Uncharacterized protein n=1 Tax=Mauremys mutica TaxID=74926 RepID=A0A9D3XTV9_9SAUR|nr:hypothetical protein KIL84_018835 [Mauremys mutica]
MILTLSKIMNIIMKNVRIYFISFVNCLDVGTVFLNYMSLTFALPVGCLLIYLTTKAVCAASWFYILLICTCTVTSATVLEAFVGSFPAILYEPNCRSIKIQGNAHH